MDKSKNQIIRTGSSLSWSEREAMIKEYLSGHFTKQELWKKYTGQDKEHGQLIDWMRALRYISGESYYEKRRNRKLLSSPIESVKKMDAENSDKNLIELQKRIKELEKQLETSQLKAEGYELMVDIAEKEFKIPIRKKSDTK